MPHVVLVVDADTKTLTDACRVMADAGYWPLPVSSFEQAKRRLALTTPDLLMTAVRLGAYNGLHLVVRCRTAFPHMPVIVTHVAGDPVLEAEATALNAVYLVTPVPPEALLTVVRDLLGGTS